MLNFGRGSIGCFALQIVWRFVSVARQATVTRRIPWPLRTMVTAVSRVSCGSAIGWEDEDDDDAEEAWDPEFQM